METKKKKEVETKPRQLLGRVKSHLKMGIVGLPNVGKSSLFNILTKCEAKCENYPFCTIDPNNARVPLPDPRWDWLCEIYKPAKSIPSYLEVVDIAGLVRGAAEGDGLGNKFLSHINAVDGIYHVVRVFEDADVTHVEGNIDALRDLEIIHHELRVKDLETLKKRMDPLIRISKANPAKRGELAQYEAFTECLEKGVDIRNKEWNLKEIEVLQELLLLTAKPIIYLVNLSEGDYIRQKNKWLAKIAQWVKQHSPDSPIIPVCVPLEQKLIGMSLEEQQDYLKNLGTKSMLDKIVQTGFAQLNLINFFTAGEDEVRAWPIQVGTRAPQAAGTIHSDFESNFIRAEVMHFADLKELGDESSVKASGKYHTEGKTYEVQDGDILLIRHNAGGAKKK